MKKMLTVLLFGALAFAQSGSAPAPADKEKKADAKKEMKCDAEMKCCKKEGKHEGKAEGHDKHGKDAKAEHAKMDCCKKEGMCERKPMKEESKEKKG